MAAQIYTSMITYTMATWADAMYNFISQYDNRFSHTNNTYIIRFDNKFDIEFRADNGNSSGATVLDLEGNVISYYGRDGGYLTNQPVSLIVDTNFVCYKEPSWKWFWFKQDSEDYFSFMAAQSSDARARNYEIDNETTYTNSRKMSYFTQISTEEKKWRIPKNFNYGLVSPKIMYANSTVIVDESGNAKKIDVLKSCSTVALESNVTVNGKNYYAVGTNTLVEVEA